MSSPHAELRGLAPGYVLGILDEDEKALFEPHLLGCSDCAAEVASLLGVVEGLAQSVPQLSPPADLAGRILTRALELAPRRPPDVASEPIVAGRGDAVHARAVMAIMAGADLVRINLTGQGAAVGSTARVLWSREHGLAFTGAALPPQPAGQQYVFWVLGGAATLKVGVLREFSGGLAVFSTPRDMAPPFRLMVTVEGPGDGQVPQGEAVLVGAVQRPA